MAQQDVQLRNLDASRDNDHVEPEPPVDSFGPQADFSLPPVDTSKDAWMFLAACWGVEAMTFGFGLSFGVFQDYYNSHAPFAGSSNIAAIGTTTTGIIYVATPFVLIVCRLYPRLARWFTLIGLVVSSLAMAMTSFCKSVPQLLVTQGIMYGIGSCIAYCPCTMYINEWFVQRRGLAFGIVWSASGAGGAVFPLIINALLERFGFQTATRICGGILFASSAPLAFFVKPRLPYSANTHNRPFNMRFVTSKSFLFHQSANIIQGTGYFLPSIYLPTYARMTFGTSSFLSALTVMLVNIATTVGLVIMGSLSDKIPVTTCMIISAGGQAISVLLIWGLSATLPVLYLFCVLYGLFAGSWASIWPGIMREVSQSGASDGYGYADPAMVQGHLCVGRGIGNIMSGPLSGSLIRGMPWQGKVLGGYGSGYGTLILYTGLTGLMSGMNFLWKRLHVL